MTQIALPSSITIKDEFPPNIFDIQEAFPAVSYKGTLFSYGDVIYAPGLMDHQISKPMINHELIHVQRQKGKHPSRWWDKYIAEPQFRLEEEFLGHAAELGTYRNMGASRDLMRLALKYVSKKFAAPLYKPLIPEAKAREYLKQAIQVD